MYVGNKRIQPKKMNVKDMYERGIMKNEKLNQRFEIKFNLSTLQEVQFELWMLRRGRRKSSVIG